MFSDCGSPPVLLNGDHNVTSDNNGRFTSGSSVTFHCDQRYFFGITGEENNQNLTSVIEQPVQELVCGGNGSWSPEYPPQCIKGLSSMFFCSTCYPSPLHSIADEMILTSLAGLLSIWIDCVSLHYSKIGSDNLSSYQPEFTYYSLEQE